MGRPVMLAVVLAAAVSSAFGAARKAEYPAEWGENVLSAAAGGRIEDETAPDRPTLGAANLIDGDVAPEQPYWAVRLQRRPAAFVVIGWPKPRRIDRVAFHGEMRGRGPYVRQVLVSFSQDKGHFDKPRELALRQKAGLQSFEVSPAVEARFMRLEIGGVSAGSAAVLEEVAAFEGRSSRAAEFRGTATHDRMELKNGDVLTGKIENETIEIQTSYARLMFKIEDIAMIAFEGGAANIERITMVNGDTFSGFILTKTLRFVLSKGQTIDIRKDKVNRLGMRIRMGGKTLGAPGDVVHLKNGDVFNGKILNPTITIKTSYATITNQIADIDRIDFTGQSKIVTKITMKNSNTMQGLLEEEDIEIDLDYGPTIMVYKDKIDRVKMRK